MKNLVADTRGMRPAPWALATPLLTISLLTILLIGMLMGASSSWASDETQSDSASLQGECELTDQKREMLAQINEARSQERQCGSQHFAAAEPLAWNCKLEAAAEMHVKDMAENDYFSHTGPDGNEIQHRVSDTGYRWQAVGENIAAGHSSSAAAVEGWLESPGHCGNIMSDAFTEMGMANAKPNSTESRYSSYWAQVLANPR